MRYRFIFGLSFLSILYERVWSSFWPVFSLFFVYVSLYLFNIVHALNDIGRLGLHILFCVGLVWSLCRPFRWPRSKDVERRLEQAAGLQHRPLTTLKDQCVSLPSSPAFQLWQKYLSELAKARQYMRWVRPNPDTARQDPYSVRYMAFILMLISIVFAGRQAPERIQTALRVNFNFAWVSSSPVFEVWVTPPEYTGLAPIFLASKRAGIQIATKKVVVPEGSILQARVESSGRPPRLYLGQKSYVFSRGAENSWLLTVPVSDARTVRLYQSVQDLGTWSFHVLQDRSPEVQIVKTEPTWQGSLKVFYKAVDDYGIQQVQAALYPSQPLTPVQGGAPQVFDISETEELNERDVTEKAAMLDTASHLRAGQNALLEITVKDAAGHWVTSNSMHVNLPERRFQNPRAQGLIRARKMLTQNQNILLRWAIARNLRHLQVESAIAQDGVTAFLTLSAGWRRLWRDHSDRATLSVQDLLWDTALQIEDSGFSVVARDAAEALQQLEKALHKKSQNPQDLQDIMNATRRSLQAYIQTLMARMMAQGDPRAAMPDVPPELLRQMLKNMDLGDMLRSLQEALQSGNAEEAAKWAEKLRKTIQNIDPDKLREATRAQKEALQAMADLKNIVQDQQQLMYKTSRLVPDVSAPVEQKVQEDLRTRLGETVRKLAESLPHIPDSLAQADQAMKQAGQELNKKAPRTAVSHQKQALELLQKGMNESAQQMAEQMQQSMLSLGSSSGGEEEHYGPGFDPLGRENEEGQGKGGDFKLPAKREQRRVQKIIEEIQRRANDYERPQNERDYLDRLLDFSK